MRRRKWLATLTAPLSAGCLRFTDSGSTNGGQDGNGSTRSVDGRFEIRYADENGTLQTAVDESGVANASEPQNIGGDRYAVPITLTTEAARRLVTALEDVGAFDRPQEHPLFVYFDGSEVHSFQLSQGLIQSMEAGEFETDPSLQIVVNDENIARQMSRSLRN